MKKTGNNHGGKKNKKKPPKTDKNAELIARMLSNLKVMEKCRGYYSEYELNEMKNRPNIGIFLTDAQHTQVEQVRKQLVDAYEAKRAKANPGVLFKWTGYAFINTDVRAHFVDGKPENAFINGTNIGPFTLNRVHKDDFEYVIDKQSDFKYYLETKKNFYLEVGYSHDGCVGGWFAHVFESPTGGKKVFSLDDIERNSQ